MDFCEDCKGLFIKKETNECQCCGIKINPHFLCGFCKLLPPINPVCNGCKVRGCYFGSPCYLEHRKLSGILLRKMLYRKIQLVYKICQLYYRSRHRIYIPGGIEFMKLQKHFYELCDSTY